MKHPWQIAKMSTNPVVSRAAIKIQTLSYGQITYVKTEELVRDTLELIKSFPIRFDAVFGIPRSGMIPASVIATQLGIPIGTSESFPQCSTSRNVFDSLDTVLLIDESADHGTGGTFDRILQRLRAVSPDTQILKACLYVREECKNYFDLYSKVHSGRRMYQWGIAHNKPFKRVAFDLDGVICEDCWNSTDEKEYLNFLATAKPYLIPEYPLDIILTSRLEKYRAQTEAWLKSQRVEYGELVMWNLPDKKGKPDPSQFKSRELLRIKPGIYFESNHAEADSIRRNTGLYVYCVRHFDLNCP